MLFQVHGNYSGNITWVRRTVVTNVTHANGTVEVHNETAIMTLEHAEELTRLEEERKNNQTIQPQK